jgi:hypothetical protein
MLILRMYAAVAMHLFGAKSKWLIAAWIATQAFKRSFRQGLVYIANSQAMTSVGIVTPNTKGPPLDLQNTINSDPNMMNSVFPWQDT